MITRVKFELDESTWQPLANGTFHFTYMCPFCIGNKFDLEDQDHGIGWINGKDNILCCSEICARMYVHDPDPPRFIDETYLYE